MDMDHVGEFSFQVNETCLSGDHRTFMVAPTDKDSQNHPHTCHSFRYDLE